DEAGGADAITINWDEHGYGAVPSVDEVIAAHVDATAEPQDLPASPPEPVETGADADDGIDVEPSIEIEIPEELAELPPELPAEGFGAGDAFEVEQVQEAAAESVPEAEPEPAAEPLPAAE